jgi:hypothetical protein
MARTTEAEVLEIMDNELTESQVTPFLTAANLLITEAFSGASTSTDLLAEIEKWFTAHMLAVTIARTASAEELGEAKVKYTGYWGKGLESTSYGQMVMTLDTEGITGSLGKASASMYAIPNFDS